GPGQVEGGRGVGAEELEAQRVGMPHRDAGGGEGRRRARGEGGGEGDEILVLDRFADVAELGRRVSYGRSERQRALSGGRREGRAAHGRDRPAQELGEIDEVAADVREG